jgi:hypothetical protein
MSNFSTTNYARINNVSLGNNFEIQIKITTAKDVLTPQGVFVGQTNPLLAVGSLERDYPNLFGYNIGNGTWQCDVSNNHGKITVLPNTTYYLKMTYDGSVYKAFVSTNKIDWELDWEFSSTVIIPNMNILIGVGRNVDIPSRGNIDLSECYININGSRFWTGATNVHENGHTYYSIVSKPEIDNIFNSTGMAWFYGIDQENERIFLPRNVWFEQMSMDDVGKAVTAGLPNITGSTPFIKNSTSQGTSGAIKTVLKGQNKNATGAGSYWSEASFDIDASRSNPIYGKSNTVQPNAVKKLLYICVGNTVSDTSWVDVVTQVANGAKDIEDKRVQALNDLNNKENAGLSALANASNALRQTQITNCLLEVPQRIKYDLTNGTLTIKAGSVVIVPYGVEDLTSQYPVHSVFIDDRFRVYDTQFADGKFFVWAELQQDVTHYWSTTSTGERIFSMSINRNNIFSQIGHGSGTENYSGTGSYLLYRTDQNKMKCWLSGVEQEDIITLPLGLAQTDGVVGWANINQVFNGFGYIGSTIWVDKGVKGLIPNGRNKDGTLNNIEFVTDKVLTRTFNTTENCVFALSRNIISKTSLDTYAYKEIENFNYSGSGTWNCCAIGLFTLTNGVVSNFNPKQPVNLATKDMVDGPWVQAYLSLGTTTAIGEYTLDLSDHLPNDGYQYEVMFAGNATNNTTEIPSLSIKTDLTGYSMVCIIKGDGAGTFSNAWNIILPVGTGRTVSFKIQNKAFNYCNKFVHSYRRMGTST